MSKIYEHAVRLLARREHGTQELITKLVQKGYNKTESTDIVHKCQELGLQSDKRFCESLLRRRIQQGYGPIRISHELKLKNIENHLIEEIISTQNEHWYNYALLAWQKKFSDVTDNSLKSIQKQKYFLQYRGFTHDIINQVVK